MSGGAMSGGQGPAAPAGLRLAGLTRWFPGAAEPTLDRLDLGVPATGCVALLGPSGSGKSTALRLVAGLDTPDDGDVLVAGRSLRGVPTERRRTAMVFQRPRLFPHLDVLDNVAFPLAVAGARARRARTDARRFLDLVGLADLARRRPASLSGGQEQRVALARALAARPDVLLLDEPFSALDPGLRTEMHELVCELRAAVEPTILLVTHDRREAAVLADTVAVLLDGRIAQHDTVSGLYTRPASMAVHRFLGGRNAVPGTVVGREHRSALGVLRLPPGDGPDGPGTLVVRQEALTLLAPGDPSADVVGTVRDVVRTGPRAAVEVEVSGAVVVCEVGPHDSPRRGDAAGVRIPLAQRHVLPDVPGSRQAAAEAAARPADSSDPTDETAGARPA